VFGGGKDGIFNRELSELLGTSRVSRTTYSRGRGSAGTSYSGVDEPILRPEEIRLLPERHALVIAENAKPLIAKLTRCVDGKTGRALLVAQAAAAGRVAAARGRQTPMFARTTAAVQTAHQLDLSPVVVAASEEAGVSGDDGVSGGSLDVGVNRLADRSW